MARRRGWFALVDRERTAKRESRPPAVILLAKVIIVEETYECDNCGACCSGRLIVAVSSADIAREPRLREAGSRPEEINLEFVDADRLLTWQQSPPCEFLCQADDQGRKLCGIYESRPSVCAAMKPGSEQCQLSRWLSELPRLEPVGIAED